MSDGAANDNFGISVALSGDTALVGAYADDVGATSDQGSAYVFTGLPFSAPSTITLTAAPPNIFPADRRYKRATLTASDRSLTPPSCSIDFNAVTQNTPQQSVPADVVLVAPMIIDLRAERPVGGTNRKYTIPVTCTGGGTAQIVVEVTGVR